MTLTKKTSLQTIGTDIKETMEWKLKQLESKNLPVEQGLADYIYLGMSGIDNEIEQLLNYQITIDDKINELKANKQATSEKLAEWIELQGLDKLNGISVSSITINKGKESVTTVKKIEELKLNKSLEDCHKFLIENGLAELVEKEKESVSKATNTTIKINKKRK
jgi:dihydroneopterin aldolase